MSWDPSVYLKFGAERTRPAADLLARVPLDAPARVVDLGCGPGNSTALIAARHPQADILGLDSSAEMIAAAKASGVGARFEIGDFETWSPGAPPDLIYANAAFQWAYEPISLVVRLFGFLAPGGALAFQVPQNFDQPSHLEVAAAAGDGPWAEQLRSAPRYDPGFAKAADYARALPHAAALDIWTTDYLHLLDGPDPVFGWMSGTGLRPFLGALARDTRASFEADVRARLARAYPPEPDGRTLFPFKRLFVVALKSGRPP